MIRHLMLQYGPHRDADLGLLKISELLDSHKSGRSFQTNWSNEHLTALGTCAFNCQGT